MVLAGFALFIIALLIIGMPVAFTLSLAGILGIIHPFPGTGDCL